MVEKDKKGRVILTKHHNIPNNEHVYVVGDSASLPHAPSAQLAEGQGRANCPSSIKALEWRRTS